MAIAAPIGVEATFAELVAVLVGVPMLAECLGTASEAAAAAELPMHTMMVVSP